MFVGGDRLGDFAVAMVQGAPGAYALTGAVFDRGPGAPFIEETTTYKRKTRPDFRWRAGIELWGAQRFPRLRRQRRAIGETPNETLTPRVPLATGTHTWQVEAVDARADQAAAACGRQIDALAPTFTVKVSGKRVAGQETWQGHCRAREGTRAARGLTTSPSTTATSRPSRRRRRRGTATSAARSG